MNRVEIKGEVKRVYRAQSSTFLSIFPEGGRSQVEVAAFDDARKAVANVNEGDTIHIIGHIGSKKDKQLRNTKKPQDEFAWVLQVVCDAVVEGNGSGGKSDDDIAF